MSATGPISDDEAEQMLSRFNSSHWKNATERARYSIPADPKRDDDIRLGAYIDQTRELRAERDALKEQLRVAVEALTRLRGLPCQTCRRDADARASLARIASLSKPGDPT